MIHDTNDTDKIILSQWATLPELVKSVVRDNKYREICQNALQKVGMLDDNILDNLSLEVLLTLLELQTVEQCNEQIENLQGLNGEQKKHILEDLYQNLFSTLALDGPLFEKYEAFAKEVLEGREVSERVSKLPEDIRSFILSPTTHQLIQRILTSTGLPDEKAEVCISQIIRSATGLSTTQDFKAFVTTDLALDAQQATLLVEYVTRNFFNPIREALLSSLQKSEDPSPTDSGAPLSEKSAGAGVDPYREQKSS